jgi:hypothetical protein
MEHWGVIEQWDYPADGKGDCEDYALFKRKILVDEGFPRQALTTKTSGCKSATRRRARLCFAIEILSAPSPPPPSGGRIMIETSRSGH